MRTDSSQSTVSTGSANVEVAWIGVTTGSGSHGPTYVSRRTRAERSWSSAIRATTRVSQPRGSSTSAAWRAHLGHASATASSASAQIPVSRYATPSR